MVEKVVEKVQGETGGEAYEGLVVEVIEFDCEDVIVTSPAGSGGEGGQVPPVGPVG